MCVCSGIHTGFSAGAGQLFLETYAKDFFFFFFWGGGGGGGGEEGESQGSPPLYESLYVRPVMNVCLVMKLNSASGYVCVCPLQVLAGDMDILHLSDELVVVNKLSSIPVHPTGNFWVSVLYVAACTCTWTWTCTCA